jgi:hypothetical protein
MDFLKQIWHEISPHLAMLGFVATWFGIGLVYLRRRSEWRRKSFLNQVNFSMNYIEQGGLHIRTLFETTVAEVWLNHYGINQVTKAAGRTRPDQPFILLDNPDDMDFVKRAVLNTLSERFADAFLARSLNRPVISATFCFALTYESYADMRTRKFRVLIVEVEALKRDFTRSTDGTELLVDESRHRDRLEVLRTMRDLYLGIKKSDVPILGELELGLPA